MCFYLEVFFFFGGVLVLATEGWDTHLIAELFVSVMDVVVVFFRRRLDLIIR